MLGRDSANHRLVFRIRKVTSNGEPISTPSDVYSGIGRSVQRPTTNPVATAIAEAATTTQKSDRIPSVANSCNPWRSGIALTKDGARRRERGCAERRLLSRLTAFRFFAIRGSFISRWGCRQGNGGKNKPGEPIRTRVPLSRPIYANPHRETYS
jgi:hypothetical protein